MYEEISRIRPLKNLNIALVSADTNQATVKISFDGNQNDKNTMFAGAIYSSLVFCGWSLAKYLAEQETAKYDVMIKKSQTSYFFPITTDAVARALLVKKETKKNGNISMIINVNISDEKHNNCVELQGEYIARAFCV